MSHSIWFDKWTDEPVRQLVPSDPDPARYEQRDVVDPDDVESECCQDCSAEHYQEGYDAGKVAGESEAEDKIEELRETITSMLNEIEGARMDLQDAVDHAGAVGVYI